MCFECVMIALLHAINIYIFWNQAKIVCYKLRINLVFMHLCFYKLYFPRFPITCYDKDVNIINGLLGINTYLEFQNSSLFKTNKLLINFQFCTEYFEIYEFKVSI